MDPNTPQTPATPETPATPATPVAPPTESAEQLYARIYGSTPIGSAPSVMPPAAQAPPPQEDLASALNAIRAELQALKTPASPQAPAQGEALEWVEKIKAGDFKGAEESMARAVQARVKPDVESVRSQAYQDALVAAQVQMDMREYLSSVRSANPDLAQFERYLQAPVAERVQQAQLAGKIRNPQDFLKEYRGAVDAEISALRNLGLQFRAAGKDEASTRNREVLSSQPLVPQQVTSPQAPPSSSQPNMEGESLQDYFARRHADEVRRRGLS